MRGTVKHQNSERGYTLVEMAMVMLIVGIIVSGGLFVWHLYKVEQSKELTETRRFRISLYMEDFKSIYGRYPCPARYDAVRGDADYGVEGVCTDVSVPPGSCSNGYCVEQSERQVTMPDGSLVTPRVRRGAIPFRTLFMDEAESYDAYRARYSYAVTELLTNWQTFSPVRGGISVVDNHPTTPATVVSPAASALYFVFSHGSDNIGAYDVHGNLIHPCNGPMLDNENCNTSPTETFAVYRSSLHSEVPVTTLDAGVVIPGGPPVSVDVNTRYDDNAYFLGNTKNPIWRISDGSRDNVHDVLPDSARRITIGNVTAAEQHVNVDDITRVSDGPAPQNGRSITSALCAENDADGDCFDPSLIAGSGTNQCAEGFGVSGVGDSAVRCRELIVDCTGQSGRFITGFDSNGYPICSDIHVPVECPQQTVELCGLSLILNQAPHNATQTLNAGASREQLWRCNDGTWNMQSESGVCSCTPSETVTTDACGEGYEGNTTTTVTTVCPSGETTTVTDRAACVCAPGTESQTIACEWPRTGTRTRTRTFICNAGGGSENWWSPWDESACVCPPQDPQTENTSCPGNLTGTATRTRTHNTTSCSWNAWSYDYSSCACEERTGTRNRACTAPLTGTVPQQRTLTCPSATWGGWTDTGPGNCTCNNRYGAPVVTECPSGLLGQITTRQLQDCHGNSVGAPETVTNTCVSPPTYSWEIIGNSTGLGPERPRRGDPCTTSGANGFCSDGSAGGGQYIRYQCRCQ